MAVLKIMVNLCIVLHCFASINIRNNALTVNFFHVLMFWTSVVYIGCMQCVDLVGDGASNFFC